MNDYIIRYFDKNNNEHTMIVSAVNTIAAGLTFEDIAENSDIKFLSYKVVRG